MASTTYRVIQDAPNLGTFTREQVDAAIRKVMAALGEKPLAAKKANLPAKARRTRSKR